MTTLVVTLLLIVAVVTLVNIHLVIKVHDGWDAAQAADEAFLNRLVQDRVDLA